MKSQKIKVNGIVVLELESPPKIGTYYLNFRESGDFNYTIKVVSSQTQISIVCASRHDITKKIFSVEDIIRKCCRADLANNELDYAKITQSFWFWDVFDYWLLGIKTSRIFTVTKENFDDEVNFFVSDTTSSMILSCTDTIKRSYK